MTGIVVLVLTWLGIIAVVSSLIPLVAILPILLYIGMLMVRRRSRNRRTATQGSAGAAAPACRLGEDRLTMLAFAGTNAAAMEPASSRKSACCMTG